MQPIAITATEYLMGRAKPSELTAIQKENMEALLNTVNALLTEFGSKRKVNSGYRRPKDNAAAGGSPTSAHLSCEAVDLEDKNGELQRFCTLEILEKYDLYMEEDEAGRRSWVHLQNRPVRSGRRIFIP